MPVYCAECGEPSADYLAFSRVNTDPDVDA